MTAQTTAPVLEATTRTIIGKQVAAIRREGLIPAVLYGNHHEPKHLSLDARTFTKLFREAGSTTLLSLKIDAGTGVKVLVHDIQRNPLRSEILHVDLYEVNMKEKLHTELPLSFVGSTDLIDIEGGSLLVVKNAVEIECLPDDLIQELEVDISVLKSFEDDIRVSDLKVPQGITIMAEADELVASVAEPRSEEELEALDEVVGEVAMPESETGVVEGEVAEGEEAAETEKKAE